MSVKKALKKTDSENHLFFDTHLALNLVEYYHGLHLKVYTIIIIYTFFDVFSYFLGSKWAVKP